MEREVEGKGAALMRAQFGNAAELTLDRPVAGKSRARFQARHVSVFIGDRILPKRKERKLLDGIGHGHRFVARGVAKHNHRPVIFVGPQTQTIHLLGKSRLRAAIDVIFRNVPGCVIVHRRHVARRAEEPRPFFHQRRAVVAVIKDTEFLFDAAAIGNGIGDSECPRAGNRRNLSPYFELRSVQQGLLDHTANGDPVGGLAFDDHFHLGGRGIPYLAVEG